MPAMSVTGWPNAAVPALVAIEVPAPPPPPPQLLTAAQTAIRIAKRECLFIGVPLCVMLFLCRLVAVARTSLQAAGAHYSGPLPCRQHGCGRHRQLRAAFHSAF